MPLRLLLAGLVLLCAVQARALERDPSTTVSAKGKVEIAFSPWNDPEAVLLKAIGEARERILVQAVAGSGEGSLEPGLADTLMRETAAAAQRQEELGLPAVLLVPASIRTLLSRFLRRTVSQLKVIAHSEVPESKIIKVTSLIGGRS